MTITSRKMSWYAFAFDNYKRARNSNVKSQLASIHTPSIPGLVSIVLPVYNGALYLHEALDSIIQQSYLDFELIIVDDGSTDETPDILNRYASRDARLRVITQDNQRLPRALSNGFRAARGEYLTWTSADNRLKADFLEKLVNCLNNHPQWDMVYANVDVIDASGRPFKDAPWYCGYLEPPGSEHVMLPYNPSELNTIANNYIGAAFMYRERVDYLIGDYSPSRFGTEDYDYWMRVNALLNLHHVDFNTPVYDYRFHPLTLTSRDEELGITQNRPYLMTFENFRQDFYLSPLAWIIEDDGSIESQNYAREIRQWISSAGHLLLDIKNPNDQHFHRLWFPAVYIKIVSGLRVDVKPPTYTTIQPWKVLVATSPDQLIEAIDPSWDICITTGKISHPPPLSHPRRGWLSIPFIDTLCTAVDIQARSSHLQIVEAEIAKPLEPRCKISVVICTYRRGEKLEQSLRSVLSGSTSEKDYEIIVVNNDPKDTQVEETIRRLQNNTDGNQADKIKLVNCPFKGLSFARNAGISEASGEIISFLDDDATARSDWLENIWVEFQKYPQAGVVGGRIMLQVPEPRPRWLKSGWEKFWGEYIPASQESTIAEQWWELPWGGNWSARREALLEIGGFRSNYGHRGSDLGGAEETVAALLIQKLGYQVVIAPSVAVIHTPNLNRFTFEHVMKTIRAGKRNEYNMFTELYIEATTCARMKSLIRNIGRNLLTALSPRRIYIHQRFVYSLNAWEDLISLIRLGGDMIRRYRQPYVMQSKYD
ncbi:MAG: glycosyltransferase [Chloroflexota bacterium]|nr:glycosyltransferase [Chloroflexota bacterium]